MFKIIRKTIEIHRNSKFFFWQSLIFAKDSVWRFKNYFNYKTQGYSPPTLEWNRMWDSKYGWEKHGDEWDNQAKFCNQPYVKWKKSIFKTFIKPYIKKDSIILEIAPGHGRWTKYLVKNSRKVILVDYNKKCINFCKKYLSKFKNIVYYVNNGKDLKFIKDNSVDFVWSYDSFIHMEEPIIESYFQEISRILKPGRSAIIHHSGNLPLLQYILSGNGLNGKRSDVTKRTIKNLAKKSSLLVNYHVDSWGEKKEYNCKLFGDYITKLTKI